MIFYSSSTKHGSKWSIFINDIFFSFKYNKNNARTTQVNIMDEKKLKSVMHVFLITCISIVYTAS